MPLKKLRPTLRENNKFIIKTICLLICLSNDNEYEGKRLTILKTARVSLKWKLVSAFRMDILNLSGNG